MVQKVVVPKINKELQSVDVTLLCGWDLPTINIEIPHLRSTRMGSCHRKGEIAFVIPHTNNHRVVFDGLCIPLLRQLRCSMDPELGDKICRIAENSNPPLAILAIKPSVDQVPKALARKKLHHVSTCLGTTNA